MMMIIILTAEVFLLLGAVRLPLPPPRTGLRDSSLLRIWKEEGGHDDDDNYSCVGDYGDVDEIVMITLSVLPPSQDVSVVSKGRGV